jgi:hypothetical protein
MKILDRLRGWNKSLDTAPRDGTPILIRTFYAGQDSGADLCSWMEDGYMGDGAFVSVHDILRSKAVKKGVVIGFRTIGPEVYRTAIWRLAGI